MLKEKVVYVFCRPKESFWQSNKESVGIGNDEANNIRSLVGSVISLYEREQS